MYESAIKFEYSFNIDIAYIKKCFEANYKPILIKEKLDYQIINNAENFFITSFNLDSLDEGYLKPNLLISFCNYISVSPRKFYDSYYKFIFSNYDKKIIKWRSENNLSQRNAAKLLKVSPVSICSWEKKSSYPSRLQFSMISKVNSKLTYR